MKMGKKFLALVMTVIMLLGMSGCTASQTTVESVMQPPTLSKDQKQIYQALQAEESRTLHLVYPETGEYLSAYVIENFDDESTEEALAFYRDSMDASSPIKINVLDKDEHGEWSSVWIDSVVEAEEANNAVLVKATEIVKVSFLKSGGQIYIAIGFRITSTTADNIQLRIYRYEDKRLLHLTSLECAEYEVFDLDEDGNDEIVTISTEMVGNGRQQMLGRFYVMQDDVPSLRSEAPLNNNVFLYTGMYKGKLESGTPALYVDYTYGSESFTDILVVENRQLTNLMQQGGTDLSSNTRRLAGLSCEDMEGYGVYCIPQNMAFPGYDKNALYYVDWMKYIDGALQQVTHTYVDYNFGYYFTLPEEWIGSVTVKKDLVNNEIVFYRWQGSLEKDADPLLKIKVFDFSELMGGKLPSGYTWLSRNGQLVYGFWLEQSSEKELNLEQKQVYSYFSLLK